MALPPFSVPDTAEGVDVQRNPSPGKSCGAVDGKAGEARAISGGASLQHVDVQEGFLSGDSFKRKCTGAKTPTTRCGPHSTL